MENFDDNLACILRKNETIRIEIKQLEATMALQMKGLDLLQNERSHDESCENQKLKSMLTALTELRENSLYRLNRFIEESITLNGKDRSNKSN